MNRQHRLQLTPLYRGEQIRDAEQPLLEDGRGEELMRTAAAGVAACAVQVLKAGGGVYGRKAAALVGSGNNGGDALYALAMLRRRGVAGYAILTRGRAHEAGLAAFRSAGGQVLDHVPADADVLIDAVVGTGFSGTFELPQVDGLDAAVRSATVIACDLPSGVDADTGAAGGDVLAAAHTVTFGGLKQGLLVSAGAHLSGRVHLVDIGLGPHLPPSQISVAAPDSDPAADPQPLAEPQPPSSSDHKYSRGTLRVLAGSAQFPGAAQLTAAAAVTTGVGMVTLEAPEPVRGRVITAWPEIVGAPPGAATDLQRTSAMVIGPGLSGEPETMTHAETGLQAAMDGDIPCILDASGLALIRAQLRRRGSLSTAVLITPHLGEARRLADDLRDPVLKKMLDTGPTADPIEAARRLAGALDCAVLLKGATTVIASADGRAVLHRAEHDGAPAAAGLATAGTGDVLCGILGALAATQDMDWLSLAAHAVHRHTHAALAHDPTGSGAFGASALLRTGAHSPSPT